VVLEYCVNKRLAAISALAKCVQISTRFRVQGLASEISLSVDGGEDRMQTGRLRMDRSFWWQCWLENAAGSAGTAKRRWFLYFNTRTSGCIFRQGFFDYERLATFVCV
jgi:hypothetical protein